MNKRLLLIACCLLPFYYCAFATNGINKKIEKSSVMQEADSLIILEDVVHTNGVYLFTHDNSQSLSYLFYNKSDKPVTVSYSIAVFTHDEKETSRKSGEFIIDAKSRITQNLVSETGNLLYGVYYALLTINEKSTGLKILEKKTYFGVTSGTKIRKAEKNEFLYGMDVILGQFHKKQYLLKWMDYTGTDIIRLGIWNNKMSEVDTYYPIYKQHNLQLAAVHDPPKELDSVKRMKRLKEKCDFLEALVKKYPEIKYHELGNEPDLKGFYPGPIEEYAYSMQEMYKAIKRGNPNTVVMNGGLCFFGEEGNTRANRFLEVVDTNFIDGFAYHAHGYGSVSERAGYAVMKNALDKVNKGSKLLFDTESGTPTVTLEQEKMQAATALQKQMFAQSKGLGFLMWFRFLMFQEPYGNLFSEREPRPVVIAYRNMVETLRGYRFYKTIDIGKKGAESYVFKENNGNGRILITWINDPVDYTIKFKLGAQKNSIEKPELIDLFGNSKPLDVLRDGSVSIPIDEKPVYIRWVAKDTSYEAGKVTPVIDIQPEIALGLKMGNRVEFIIKNPENKTVNATIDFTSHTSIPVYFTPAVINTKLKAGEVKTITVSAFPKPTNQKISWPAEWTIYTGIDNYKLEGLTSVPASIQYNETLVQGYKVAPEAGVIDFEKISGMLKVRAVALAFAEIQSGTDTLVTIGTSGDWWMDWYVNGEPVYNTLKEGNKGTMSVSEHVFKIQLKKGKNSIAAKVLSGSGGWKLAFSAGQELANVLNKTQDNIEIKLKVNSKLVETEKSLVNFIKPITWLPAMEFNKSGPGKWNYEAPNALIKDKGVFNFFDKFPDNKKWWKGEKDLSAKVWLRQDEKNFNIIVQVMDDQYRQPSSQTEIMRNDAIMIAFANKATKQATEYIVTSIGQNAFVGKYAGHYLLNKLSKENRIKATVKHENGLIWYQVTVPKELVNGNDNYMNIMINDGDWGERKQYMEWLPGLGKELDFGLWHKMVF